MKQSNMQLKINYEGNIKRAYLPETYDDFLHVVQRCFQLDIGAFSIQYKDDEDDIVGISNQFDLEQAIIFHEKEKKTVFKVIVKKNIVVDINKEDDFELVDSNSVYLKNKTESMPKEPLSVHIGFTCDGCEVFPIVGDRYNCTVCQDFDFCSKCEQKNVHSHVFTKIKNPTQAKCQDQLKESLPVHFGFTCDGCESFPIVGDRYNCTVCKNFDYCSKCEEKNTTHDHAFLKIKTPVQARGGNYRHHNRQRFRSNFFNPMKNMWNDLSKKLEDPSFKKEMEENCKKFQNIIVDFVDKAKTNDFARKCEQEGSKCWQKVVENINTYGNATTSENIWSQIKENINKIYEAFEKHEKVEDINQTVEKDVISLDEKVDRKDVVIIEDFSVEKEEPKPEYNDFHQNMLKEMKLDYDLSSFSNEQVLKAIVKANGVYEDVFLHLF